MGLLQRRGRERGFLCSPFEICRAKDSAPEMGERHLDICFPPSVVPSHSPLQRLQGRHPAHPGALDELVHRATRDPRGAADVDRGTRGDPGHRHAAVGSGHGRGRGRRSRQPSGGGSGEVRGAEPGGRGLREEGGLRGRVVQRHEGVEGACRAGRDRLGSSDCGTMGAEAVAER